METSQETTVAAAAARPGGVPRSRPLEPRVGPLEVEILAGTCDAYDRQWAGDGGRLIRDDFSRLYALDSGRAELLFSDGSRQVLRPGFLTLIPAGRAARYRCLACMRLAWVHWRIEILPMMDLFARWEPPLQVPCTTSRRAELDGLLHDLDDRSPAAAFGSAGRLLRLLRPFLPPDWDSLLPAPDRHRRLAPALAAMTKDLTRPWTLAELAAIVHLHPTYFSNLCREVFGVPPLRYLTQLRLRRARDLLLGTDQPIGDVAGQCGFGNPLHFSRVFRQATGVCPRTFRTRGGAVMP